MDHLSALSSIWDGTYASILSYMNAAIPAPTSSLHLALVLAGYTH
jgi:hypothetical protein